MLRIIYCLFALSLLTACISEPLDPSFMGAREIDTQEAAKTRISLGLTYLKNGNFSQAKFNLDKALEFAPRDGQAHFAMAFYYQQVGEIELAQESYEDALNFSNNDPDVLNSYGAFLCQEGRYNEAKNYFLQAVNDRSYASTAQTYENLAICSKSQGINAEAIEYFTSALKHQPTRTRSLYLLTSVYIEEEQWQEAKRSLFKYERVAPVSAETLYMQFQIAQGLQDMETAMGYGEILTSLYPQHASTKRYLAQMGRLKPAATILRKVSDTSLEGETDDGVVTDGTAPDDNTLSNNEIAVQEVIIDTPSTELLQSKEVLNELAGEEQQAAIVDDTNESIVENIEEFNELDTETQLQALLDSESIDQSANEVPAQLEAEAGEQMFNEATELVETDSVEKLANVVPEQVDIELVKQFPNEAAEQLEAEVAEQLAEEVPEQLEVEVSEQLGDELPEQLEAEVSEQLAEEVPEQLAVEVSEQLADEVPEQLEAEVAEQLADEVPEQAEAEAIEQFADEIPETLDTEAAEQNLLSTELDDQASDITTSQNDSDEFVGVPEEAIHIVQPGENLYRISVKYNVRMDVLVEWNDLNGEAVEVDEKLWVRDPSQYD